MLPTAIYFSDFLGNMVWAIERDGTLTLVAGDGSKGYAGDEGSCTIERLPPSALVLDVVADRPHSLPDR